MQPGYSKEDFSPFDSGPIGATEGFTMPEEPSEEVPADLDLNAPPDTPVAQSKKSRKEEPKETEEDVSSFIESFINRPDNWDYRTIMTIIAVIVIIIAAMAYANQDAIMGQFKEWGLVASV